LYLAAIKNSEQFRPPNWKEKYRKWLHHPIPYVRELTLKNIPEPVPADLRVDIANVFDTSDPDVLIAACQLVEKNKLSECRAGVITALRSAKDEWLLSFASDAATAVGANLEKTEVLVSRLGEKDLKASRILSALASTLIDRRYNYDSERADKADQNRLKKRWLEFIQRNRDGIQANKKFKSKGGALSADLFPGFTFYNGSTE
jgi:hypothetical protein